jgi:hypothetical protein
MQQPPAPGEKIKMLDLGSNAAITVPAFLAASFPHILSTASLLPPNLYIENNSSALFTHPILYAHKHMADMGAQIRTVQLILLMITLIPRPHLCTYLMLTYFFNRMLPQCFLTFPR